jgi:hypothetical protein
MFESASGKRRARRDARALSSPWSFASPDIFRSDGIYLPLLVAICCKHATDARKTGDMKQ